MIEKLCIYLALINILMDSAVLALVWRHWYSYDTSEDEIEIVDNEDILKMELIDCGEDDV